MSISTLQKEINKQLDGCFEEMVEIRRHFHMYPELSFQEEKTAAFIASYYESLGVPIRTNVGGRGVLAYIEGSEPGPTVALRADFDALPIQDEKDVPYASKVPGVMHACGHDGHTAALLAVAKVLHQNRHELKGTFVMIHQHAEEYYPGGAKPMIDDGCLENADVIFGTHLWATEPLGTILCRPGAVMAAADRFTIKVFGKGGHGAHPHDTKDAVLIGSQIVSSLQHIVSRKVNPIQSAVISTGSFIADNPFNVIADQAVLIGTARSFDENVRDILEKEIEAVVKGICSMHGASYEYTYEQGYPAVVNHPAETNHLVSTAKNTEGVLQVIDGEPQMGGEDFAYYLQNVKGTFFFTGAAPEQPERVYSHHHPKFDINEKAMLTAAKVLAGAAITYHQL
ncbi:MULTISPECIES: N-acetyl amino acid acetylase SndC [Bacillus]|uniref:N-acetyl amino acid acetylase SndC n=1 Tax=Bacillus TaxID=1386 RepID=UPI0006276A16|nr:MULTISPECIES: N-acetyl amino acid acetylase SndC [Bacillus]AOL32779.1 peptidase M20 [Alkalicoccobacillus gibsonii]AOL28139.1 peptidase M20 [Bacillus sp. FJAT-14266]KKJ79837.1 putative amidohydrolase YhaA [Bacillus subtilis]KOS72655.1 peptidase M20 [Bacillus subtilis]MBL3638736.1 N-acetyl amino acid acetylase SndC [Alkalicoccobacillus gibsonii]